MLYDGKQASLDLQSELQSRIKKLSHTPVLAIISIATHPSITSFIKIKRKFAEAAGITIQEFDFPESAEENELVKKIQELSENNLCDGIIVQLPLPKNFDVIRILNTIPPHLDVDVLGLQAWNTFITTSNPLPPVAGAIAYILKSSQIHITDKKVVIVGRGKLVGIPVTQWFIHQGVNPVVVDIETDEVTRLKLYKDADIIISGIGLPHHLKPEYFKEGVILIDAGTSEQSGALAGDCNPTCASIASLYTPVPGGVGPLTVATLFQNVVASAEKNI